MKTYNYNIILGVDEESNPVTWYWKTNNALAIIGKGGSGKTFNSAYWMTQWACQGVRFLLADPHMVNKQSLYAYTEHIRDAFIMPCVSEYDTIMEYIRYIDKLGKKRIDSNNNEYPLVFVIDEFTSFVIKSDETRLAAKLLLNSVNQYRKADIRLMLIGQTWGDAVKVTSGLRDAISSSVIHKAAFNDANKFTAFPTTAKQANLLVQGQAYYEDEMIWIPMMTGTSKLIAKQRVDMFRYAQIKNTVKSLFHINERNLNDYRT